MKRKREPHYRPLPFVCTAAKPWTPHEGLPVEHPSARPIGERTVKYPNGDVATARIMRCPHCGFEIELWR